MIRIFYFIVLMTFLSVGSYAYGGFGDAEGKVTVKTINEKGNILKNIHVTVAYSLLKTMNPWDGRKGHSVKGFSNSSGTFSASSKGLNEIYISAWKDKYYKSGQHFKFKDRKLGRWQPWNPTITITLRKKVNPIPMYARLLFDLKCPEHQKKFAYDFLLGDWVEPHGKGKIKDIVFDIEKKLERKVEGEYGEETLFDERVKISFPNSGDGLIEHPVKLDRLGSFYSELRLPLEASDNGYKSEFIKRYYKEKIGQSRQSSFRKNMNYFLRIRTKKDKNGKITSALYGKIYGDFEYIYAGIISNLTYYINPTPNDRNVEFSPEKNLFKNLTRRERVDKP